MPGLRMGLMEGKKIQKSHVFNISIFLVTGGVIALWERNTQMLEVLRIARYSLDSQNY